MKKIIVVALLIACVGGGVWYVKTRPPESQKILAEMKTVLYGPGSDGAKLQEYAYLRMRLAGAFAEEKNYAAAISIVTEDIQTMQKQERDNQGRYGKRSSESYNLESAHFQHLAALYEASGDGISAEKARKKADISAEKSKRGQKIAKKPSVID